MLRYDEQIDHTDVQKAFLVSGISNDAAFAIVDLVDRHGDRFDRFLKQQLNPSNTDFETLSRTVEAIMGSLGSIFALYSSIGKRRDAIKYLSPFIAAELGAPRAGVFYRGSSNDAYSLQKFSNIMNQF